MAMTWRARPARMRPSMRLARPNGSSLETRSEIPEAISRLTLMPSRARGGGHGECTGTCVRVNDQLCNARPTEPFSPSRRAANRANGTRLLRRRHGTSFRRWRIIHVASSDPCVAAGVRPFASSGLTHMNLLPLALLAVAHQQPPAPAQTLPPSPVARIVISPATRTIQAGDSVRFTAQALDATGARIETARVTFQPTAGDGEGSIDSTGMLVASSVGKMPINVVAIVPGTRPKIEP